MIRPGLLLVAALAAVTFFGTYMLWPLHVWAPVWALILCVGLVVATVFDLGEKSDQ